MFSDVIPYKELHMAKKKEKNSTQKLIGNEHSAQARAAESKAATALGKTEIKKIQGLLTSKTGDGVTIGLSLLESLGATSVDYETVFTKTVIRSILGSWVAEAWGAVAKAIVPYGAVSELFQKLAEEKFLKRPRRLCDFDGLRHARVPPARAAFLTTWDGSLKPEKRFIDLVEIPAGTFMMGSAENEVGRTLDAEDQVTARITKPFRMARTVVTQGQWWEVMGTEPWRYAGLEKHQCGDDFPAVYVSWADAVLFCQMLTDLERETGRLKATQSYRLPTEAEWEYACRAGTTTAYSFGDSPQQLKDHGWYDRNSRGRLHKVAGKKPNPWGLFDMHGNVWEWCADWYADKLAGGDDPVGPAAECDAKHFHDGTRPDHVTRGGEWDDEEYHCRSAFRRDPRYRSDYGGFRVVLEG